MKLEDMVPSEVCPAHRDRFCMNGNAQEATGVGPTDPGGRLGLREGTVFHGDSLVWEDERILGMAAQRECADALNCALKNS